MAYYTPKEVETQLEIKTATLRKYAGKLEEAGYEFQKNAQNHRYYSDNDVMTLRKLIQIKDDTKMVLEDCAAEVMKWRSGDVAEEPEITTLPRSEARYDESQSETGLVPYSDTLAVADQLMRSEAIIRMQQEMMQDMHELMEAQKLVNERNESIIKDQKLMQTENRLQYKRVEESLESVGELLKVSNEREQLLLNEFRGGIREMKLAGEALAESKVSEEVAVEVAEPEVQKPKEKSRSMWQRLFHINESN